MANTFQSGFETTLALRLDPTDTTATLASVPTVTKGRMYLDNGEQKEWIKFTGVSGSTITGLVRGLSQTADPSTAGTGLTWIAGTKIKLVAMHDQLLDKNEGDDALISAVVYADTTARDTALGGDGVATINYTNIKTTADGLFWRYNTTTGVWETIDTGTVTANASTTVAGKVEQSTPAQNTAGTATGETGAPLFSTPADLATTIQSGSWVYCASSTGSDTYTANLTPSLTAYTTGMLLPCKFTTTNTGACSININGLGVKNIKTKDGNDPQTGVIRANGTALLMYDGTNFVIQSEDFATATVKGTVEMLTDAEAVTGTDETRYVNSKQLKNWIGYTLIPISMVGQNQITTGAPTGPLLASADNTVSVTNTSYTKVKEIAIPASMSGTISVYFEARHNNASGSSQFRIYVNGVAAGTEYSVSSSSATYVGLIENIGVSGGDLVQLYVKYGSFTSGSARYFRLIGGILPSSLVLTVNTN